MKLKIISFIVSLILILVGTFNYFFNFIEVDLFDLSIWSDLYFLFFSFGQNFVWLSYYIFPSMKISTAFIIDQILYLPVLWGFIYLSLKLVISVRKKRPAV